MNRKNTWIYAIIAAGLFAFIFFFERHVPLERVEPQVLPQFSAAEVTAVQIRPAGQVEIRADRTNGGWELSRPIVHPAQGARVEALLGALGTLKPDSTITARELLKHRNADEEYGFGSPQFSLSLQFGDAKSQILVGNRTAPGDQVFVQIVGVEGVFVVKADFLKLIPRAAGEWRDTALVDLKKLAFDRLSITRGGRSIELLVDAANQSWTMTHPMRSRADGERVASLLAQLLRTHATRFAGDGAKADLEAFGLQPAELEIGFARGTNPVAQLQFGKSPPNNAAEIFAHRVGVNSVITVSNDFARPLLGPWQDVVNSFRDPFLVELAEWPAEIEVRGGEAFTLQNAGSNSWKLASGKFAVDAELAGDFISALTWMKVVQFKDAVTELDLPALGLAKPALEIILRGAAGGTNREMARLSFGRSADGKVFARRADEEAVYEVRTNEFGRLPSADWQLRGRRVWNVREDEVARLVVTQDGKRRELVHDGTNEWSFAKGSQGFINPFAVEEAAHRLGDLSALAWTGVGDAAPAANGFTTNSPAIEIVGRDGTSRVVRLGPSSGIQTALAAATVDGQACVFEIPFGTHLLVMSHLAIPPGTP